MMLSLGPRGGPLRDRHCRRCRHAREAPRASARSPISTSPAPKSVGSVLVAHRAHNWSLRRGVWPAELPFFDVGKEAEGVELRGVYDVFMKRHVGVELPQGNEGHLVVEDPVDLVR